MLQFRKCVSTTKQNLINDKTILKAYFDSKAEFNAIYFVAK